MRDSLVNFTCPQTDKAGAFVPVWREEEVGDHYCEVLCVAYGWFHRLDGENGRMINATDDD